MITQTAFLDPPYRNKENVENTLSETRRLYH